MNTTSVKDDRIIIIILVISIFKNLNMPPLLQTVQSPFRKHARICQETCTLSKSYLPFHNFEHLYIY